MVERGKILKIMFLCGSLEEGKDGVGDYVRRLCAVLNGSGHSVVALAFNDRYVEQQSNGLQEAEGTALRVLRLPQLMPIKQKQNIALAFVQEFDPDVISLQFVAYAFHKKGIPLLLRENLQILFADRGVHIMFHELWLDAPIGLRQKIIALVQQRLIRKLVRKLNPQSVHVSIPFNKWRLESLRVRSEILQLFGNIYADDQLDLSVDRQGGQQTVPPSILYFGSAPTGVFRETLLSKLAEFCKGTAHRMRLMLVSGNSQAKDEFYQLLQERLIGTDYEIVDHGFLSVAELSGLMRTCSVGIVRSEPHLLGKSGTAIAMLEHGLPIWLPKMETNERIDCAFRPELIFSDLKLAVDNGRRLGYHSLLPEVAEQFICQIKNLKK